MAKTTQMRLIELMILKQDIQRVIEYLGKKGSFQFQTKLSERSSKEDSVFSNLDKEFFDRLQNIRNELGFSDVELDLNMYSVPTDEMRTSAADLFASFDELSERIKDGNQEFERVSAALKEALAFANLKVPYSELEHLSFLSMKIGKIDPKDFDNLKDSVGINGVIIALGDDKSHIMAVASKKGRFALDSELKRIGFKEVEIPKDFHGIPDDVLEGLQNKKAFSEKKLAELLEQKKNYAETHREKILTMLGSFAIGTQVSEVASKLESTDMVYRLTGWIPFEESNNYMIQLDNITEGRIAIRIYEPYEVPGVISGKEQVPVKLRHGKFVSSFERMIFSYGAPAYGSVDPTPFVAIFFTFLFGFMFGDFGQGLFIALFGFLMGKNIIKVGGWNKFSPIFIAVGITSSLMGLLTGECFSTEHLLEPFAMWVTGFFGTPHAPIIKMMPSSDPSSIITMFSVFGAAVAVGFIINSIGLVINVINNISRKKWGSVLFGKNGLAGIIWFWYVVALVVRIFAFKHSIAAYDWIVIGITLFFAAFGEPFERLLDGERPVMENGFGSMVIGGVVELIEVISTYLSNTVSFIRVGAFALSHAVLGYLVLTLSEMVHGFALELLVLILGNAIIIVLEGMIVAIQVIRLQYYEFFSKFFKETGREFKPFKFEY